MHTIDFYRGVDFLATIKPDGNSAQNKTIMGPNEIALSFELNFHAGFRLGDWCMVFGERYHLNTVPVVEVLGSNKYRYKFTMQAEGHDISKAQFLFLDPVNELLESDFPFTGNAADFMQLLKMNIDRVLTGFTIGEVIASEYKTLSFSKENCYNALSRIATEFGTEFWIIGKTIHLAKRSTDTSYTFRQGIYKGLYDVTRKDLNNATVVTRLHVRGSDKNLPPDYRGGSKRLRMPGPPDPCLISNVTCQVTKGVGNTIFKFFYTPPASPDVTALQIEYRISGTTGDWLSSTAGVASPRQVSLAPGIYEFRFRSFGGSCSTQVTEAIIVSDTFLIPMLVGNAASYIERNTEVYGVIEHTEVFEDVYPHRTGKVTAVNAANVFEFSDATLDFDVWDYLQPGLEAKLHIKTGQLSGCTFKIKSYNHTFKTFILHRNQEDLNIVVPNASLKLAIGDEYVLIDIRMPETYITAAEQELLNKARALMATISEEQGSYSVNVDPVFLKQKQWNLSIGSLVNLRNDQLGLNKKIRITKTTRNIVEEYKYTFELADVISPGTVTRILAATADNTRDLTDLGKQVGRSAIFNNTVIGTLKFDSLPETSTTTGFTQLYIKNDTGEIYKKV